MLETCENVQLYFVLVVILASHSILLSLTTFLFYFLPVSLISVLWLPLILVQDTGQLFDVWWEIVILGDEILLLFSVEIINRVQNGMEPKLQFAKLFSIVHVQKLGEFND